MEEGYSGGLCVCVYVDSHLRFQFDRDWFEVDQ